MIDVLLNVDLVNATFVHHPAFGTFDVAIQGGVPVFYYGGVQPLQNIPAHFERNADGEVVALRVSLEENTPDVIFTRVETREPALRGTP